MKTHNPADPYFHPDAPTAQTDQVPREDEPPMDRLAPGGATGASNLTAHLNDPALRRAPPGKTPGADDAAAEEGAHSDRSPLADAQATPVDEETRRRLDAAVADSRARHGNQAERDAVRQDREADMERQKDRLL